MKQFLLKSLFASLIFISCASALGQIDYRGAITKQDGTTVQGFIKSWEFKTNPSEIYFKENNSTEYQKLTVSDMKSFQIEAANRELYVGGTFDIELSSKDPNSLSDTSALKLEKVTGFLQVLIEGPKSLYVYRNTINDQFYIKQDTAFELLVYKKYIKKQRVGFEERSLVYENKRYQGQLAVYLEGCDKVKSGISKLSYKLESFIKAFTNYYQCNKNPYQIYSSYKAYNPEKISILKPGFIVGVSMENLDFNELYPVYDMDLDPMVQISPVFGLSLEIPLGIKNSSALFEYLRGYVNQEVLGKTSQIENVTIKQAYKFHYSSMKINVLYRYRIPAGKLYYFGNAGLSRERLKGDFQNTTTFIYPNSQSQSSTGTDSKLNALRAIIGAGVRYNKMSVEARIEPSFDKMQRFMANIIFNYYFGKKIQ